MFQRAKLPNTLASPTGTSRGRVNPLTDSTNETWTRSRLEKERIDWWDTQVTGSQEVWGAIRLAAQSLQVGKIKDAQQWLETMECTCPTGCLWKGVYDSTGIMYKVPEWLIVEPEGLVSEEQADEDAAAGAASGVDAAQQSDDDDDNEPLLVRARISRDGRDVTLKIRRKEPVAIIIEKLKKEAEVRSSKPYIPSCLLCMACHIMWLPTLSTFKHLLLYSKALLTATVECICQRSPRLCRTRIPRQRNPRIASLLGLCERLHRQRTGAGLIRELTNTTSSHIYLTGSVLFASNFGKTRIAFTSYRYTKC